MFAEPKATKLLLQRLTEVSTLLTSSLCAVAMAHRQRSHGNSFQIANSSELCKSLQPILGFTDLIQSFYLSAGLHVPYAAY